MTCGDEIAAVLAALEARHVWILGFAVLVSSFFGALAVKLADDIYSRIKGKP